MKYISRILAAFFIVLHLTGTSRAEWKNIAESPGGFVAGLWITGDKTVIESSSRTASIDAISVTNSVEPGEQVYLVIVFSNRTSAQGDEVSVKYDIVVRQPNGEVLAELENAVGVSGRIEGDTQAARLGNDYLEIPIGDIQSGGRYTVRAEVREEVGNSVLTLHQYFDVPSFPLFEDYDFTHDYRTEKQKETEHLARKEEEARSMMLQPVEGISLEQWAVLCAWRLYGESMPDLLDKKGIKKEAWMKADRVWNERMSQDKEFHLVHAYAIYFYGAGIGRYREAGRDLSQAMANNTKLMGTPPVPEKQWIEITKAIQKGTATGEQPDSIIKAKKLNPYDWYVISNWWARAKVERSK